MLMVTVWTLGKEADVEECCKVIEVDKGDMIKKRELEVDSLCDQVWTLPGIDKKVADSDVKSQPME